MQKYSESSIYISTVAKLPGEMPAAGMYKSLDMGVVINRETGVIEDIGITLLTNESQDFLKWLIIGYSFHDGIEDLQDTIRNKYFGGAQKALAANLKLLYDRYQEILEKSKRK